METYDSPGNPWAYDPDPEEVYDAILSVDPLGDGTQRFARRLLDEIQIRAGGYTQRKPVVFLLIGDLDSPLEELTQAVANTWIGEPWGGLSPINRIETIEHLGNDASSVSALIGPTEAIGGGAATFEYGVFGMADKLARIGDTIIPMQTILGQMVPVLFNERHPMHRNEEFRNLAEEISSRIGSINDEAGPWRSVFHINGVEAMLLNPPQLSIWLLRVLRQMLVDSGVQIIDGGMSYTSNSIVLLTLRLPDGEPKELTQLKQLDGETPESRFNRILGVVGSLPIGNELLKIIGEEHVIIVDQQTEASVAARRDLLLDSIADSFRDEFDIKLRYTQKFKEFLLAKSRHPDIDDRFPNGRLPYWIRRYVFGTLVRRAAQGGVVYGATVTLREPAANDSLKHARSRIDVYGASDNAPVDTADIQRVFGEDQRIVVPRTDEADAFDERLHDIMNTKAPGQYL